jgi:hypothetical protein
VISKNLYFFQTVPAENGVTMWFGFLKWSFRRLPIKNRFSIKDKVLFFRQSYGVFVFLGLFGSGMDYLLGIGFCVLFWGLGRLKCVVFDRLFKIVGVTL